MTRFKKSLPLQSLQHWPCPQLAWRPLPETATLRVANQGDATSLDPHSLNESLQLSITGNVYEPLVGRDRKDLGLEPALGHQVGRPRPPCGASTCAATCAFHDGTPFTAEDVVFSFGRASPARALT
jgi:peptide/nickel transport system substrate-binding protein